MRTVLRYLLLAAGWLALGLGVIGLFLPVLPTTPLVLVAAACFLRSSERLHRRVIEHPVLGPPVRDFQAGRGVTKRTKIVAITMLWACIVTSAVFFVPHLAIDILLIAVAVGVTIYLLLLPTANRGVPSETPAVTEPSE